MVRGGGGPEQPGLLSLRVVEGEYDLKPDRIRSAVKAKELAGYTVGRALFVERAALEAWIRTHAAAGGEEDQHAV